MRTYLCLCVLAACAETPSPTVAGDGSDLDVPLVLPAAVGGGGAITRTASHDNGPSHSYGIPLPIPKATNSARLAAPPAVPASVDLSSYAPPPGDQGQTGSCQSWSTGYSAMGWWANRYGLSNAKTAPMYLYSQLVAGHCDQGAYVEQPLALMQSQGVDTTSDYEPMQQVLDCKTQPTELQTANAANFRISGFTQWDLQQGTRQAITSALASGRPAILSIVVYPELDNANAQSYLVGPPLPGEQSRGGHAIAAFGYDANGVWIMNSWGNGWGTNGWAELSWDFVEGSFDGTANVGDVATIDGLALSCSDSNAQCEAWAAESQCQENPDYMLTNCCASCATSDAAYRTYAFESLAQTSSCLDAWGDGTTNGTLLDEWPCNGTTSQTFTIVNAGHGAVNLWHPHGALCVDDPHQTETNGTQMQLYRCNRTDAQGFNATWFTDGSVSFQRADSSSCLDVDRADPTPGTHVQMWGCNQTVAQRWFPIAQ
jgi:Papain family cysteine protease/Ricin-type beta-trefoil lectin domain